MILINGQTGTTIACFDRGLMYGDGLFETLLYRDQTLVLIDEHLTRLQLGCERLGIKLDISLLQTELQQVISRIEDQSCVFKIMVTRGVGGRGYQAPKGIEPTRIISTHPLPVYPIENQFGIQVRYCQTKAGISASLAGMKHLNRLEQVMARSEWEDTSIGEGLMLDANDNVIEGTMSNLFIVRNGTLITPELSLSGVQGVMRDKIIQVAQEASISVSEQPIKTEDIHLADEVFVCNSLIGIWPVIKVIGEGVEFNQGPITKRLQNKIKHLHA